MDCNDVALLLAADGERTLTTSEDQDLHHHVADCETCRALTTEADGTTFRWLVRVPEDALGDRNLLVLPVVDPVVFEASTEIARGGMGRIVRAHDRRLDRDVAIKEVLGAGSRARFEREVAITAKLQHPAIVPVYEAGAWPNGAAFYTMRLVSGGTLAQAIARTTTLEERLALLPHVTALTEAIAYAHSRRIVHRDLKPGNVLVGEFGETVVIDWGLAKDLDDESAESATNTTYPTRLSDLTIVGSVMGTPGFMSPEQAAGDEVDERCDVYALGAILYSLLSGRPPHLDLATTVTPEMMIELARARAPNPIGEAVPDTPMDLRAIVDRAMARDPASRFASAKEMAEELRRFQSGQLLRSRAYGLRELLVRWLRRHRTAVVVGAIAATLLVVVGVAAIVGIARSRSAERDARRSAERALAESQLEEGRQLLVAGNPDAAAPLIATALAQLPDHRMGRRLDALARRDAHRRIARIPGSAAAFSPDGKLVAVGRADGSIALLDAASGAPLRTLPAAGADPVDHRLPLIGELAFTPDGARLLVAGETGATMRDARTGAVVATIASIPIREARLVGADSVALASADSIMLVTRGGSPMRTVAMRDPHGLDVSHDGAAILVRTGAVIAIVDARDLTRLAELPDGEYTYDAHFDRDGSVITAASNGGRHWSIAPTRELARLPIGYTLASIDEATWFVGGELVDLRTGAHREIARDVTIQCNAAIDRRHVITGGFDRVIRIWDVERGAFPIVAIEAATATERLIIDSSGTRLASLGRGPNAPVELWNLSALPAPRAVAKLGGMIDHMIADRSQRLAVRWQTGGIVHTELLAPSPQGPYSTIATLDGWPMEFRPGADEIVTDDEGRLIVASSRDGHKIREITGTRPLYHIAFSPSGARVATASQRHVELRPADNWTILGGFDVASEVTALALDDSDQLVVAFGDGTLQIWNAQTGELVRTLTGHTAHVSQLAIRGTVLFSDSWDLTTRRWAFPSGDPLGVASVWHRPVDAIAVSPDGDLIAIADRTAALTLWDGQHGRLLQAIPTTDELKSVVFLDDTHVAVGGTGGRIELVDIVPAGVPPR